MLLFYKNIGFDLNRLDLLDKIDPPVVQEGYGMCLAFYSLLEVDRSVQYIIEEDSTQISPEKNKDKIKKLLSGLLFEVQ